MTNDPTQDQSNLRAAPDDDVAGHLRPLDAAPEDDDVKGHLHPLNAAPDDDDDVKGHRIASFDTNATAAAGDDDVEGHNLRTYPSAAAGDDDDKSEFYGRL